LQDGSQAAFNNEHRSSSASIGLKQGSSVAAGLNSYSSLNRAVRIKDMARIVEDNKLILKKLQLASSFYSIDKWEQDNKHRKHLVTNICRNSDRFCKNPYFLHSLATTTSDAQMYYNPNLPCKKYTDSNYM
jgi:inosine/xanthosine triphosphate pyrophosphatase family protein